MRSTHPIPKTPAETDTRLRCDVVLRRGRCNHLARLWLVSKPGVIKVELVRCIFHANRLNKLGFETKQLQPPIPRFDPLSPHP